MGDKAISIEKYAIVLLVRSGKLTEDERFMLEGPFLIRSEIASTETSESGLEFSSTNPADGTEFRGKRSEAPNKGILANELAQFGAFRAN
jgi:hypothetical protein